MNRETGAADASSGNASSPSATAATSGRAQDPIHAITQPLLMFVQLTTHVSWIVDVTSNTSLGGEQLHRQTNGVAERRGRDGPVRRSVNVPIADSMTAP